MGKFYCLGYESKNNTHGSVFCPVHDVKIDYSLENEYSVDASDRTEAMNKVLELVKKNGEILKGDTGISDLKLGRSFV